MRAAIAGPVPSRAPEHNEPLADHLAGVTADDDFTRTRLPDPPAWPARRDLAVRRRDRAHRLESRRRGGLGPARTACLELLMPERRAARRRWRCDCAGLALCSDVREEHLTAVDLLIAAIDDGRVDAAALVAALREDLARGLITEPARPAADDGRRRRPAPPRGRARPARRDVSDLAALEPRTYAALLVPFDELCAQTGTGVHARRARSWPTLTGSSKAAKAARSLLARDGEPPPRRAHARARGRVCGAPSAGSGSGQPRRPTRRRRRRPRASPRARRSAATQARADRRALARRADHRHRAAGSIPSGSAWMSW